MKRVNLIYNHPVFQEKFQALQEAEKDREFCKHTLEHFMDVARLMYIDALEHDLSISKELIYATALMHDIGRIDQIEQGIPHEQAGAVLCDVILTDCGFSEEETEVVKAAILHHRNEPSGNLPDKNLCDKDMFDEKKMVCENDHLCEILYRADKKSRNCFACEMKKECNWDEEKMNLKIGN